MPDLLIELFSEEIPARMQARAAADLKRLVTDGLVEAGLTYASAGAFHTPRRLALSVEGLSSESPDTREERKGPKVGAPDKAIEGFCRGAGVDRTALEVRDTGKAQVYFAVIAHKGRPAPDIVAEVLDHTVRHFPWPKSMRWGAGALRWVRPLQSILCLLTDEDGAQIVPLEIDGINAGNTTRGHRFMAPDAFAVTSFEDYEAKLKQAKVLLRAEERADHIRQEAVNLAFAAGLELVEDPGLLAEVAGLVEWPVVLMGEIDADFLHLPPEVLQTSMKEHQKFFSLRDKTGQITRFVTVANIAAPDGGSTILAGNQKVLAARLADARFFWDNDLRVARAGMQDWCDGLGAVTFHAKLGSQAERVTRIAALAREIAPHVGADPEQAQEAARIAKADLRSEMVGEFPELQGVMGRYYALEAGRSPEVADACRDHWKPMGQDDDVPSAPVSVAVALADKIDTLTGFWAIDEKPTGSKDPYALRRAALGVIRLLLAKQNKLSIQLLVATAHGSLTESFSREDRLCGRAENGNFKMLENFLTDFDETDPDYYVRISKDGGLGEDNHFRLRNSADVQEDLLAFFHDRLKVHLRGAGIRHDVIDACLAMEGADDLTLLVKRAEALETFLRTEDGENLIQGFKRANNILTQAEDADGVEYSFGADIRFAEDAAETALFAALDDADTRITPAMAAEDFAGAMAAMAGLRAPIDAFFEQVQINADSAVLRRNRLNLLSRIRTTCLAVADLRRIEG
ncbi:glycine--tRNA ligase subunit beta [Salibaculum halophilum]|uniref:glycine--tRNA ligase subunit beta n=1 Tax=Salibaculum halophilum TaxID=1914408 RepID=UPI000A111342|nr:glycine--tRNA ligase subunit beta [Salibaculum halophilum]